MKSYKNVSFISFAVIVMIFLFQCANIPKLEKNAPSIIEAAYYQKWNAGIKEGGSGVNIYIETRDASVIFDSIYFRGQGTKLLSSPNNSLLFVGRFKSNNKSSDQTFSIEDHECVVSYLNANKVRYFKISNLKERETINYPSSPSNDN